MEGLESLSVETRACIWPCLGHPLSWELLFHSFPALNLKEQGRKSFDTHLTSTVLHVRERWYANRNMCPWLAEIICAHWTLPPESLSLIHNVPSGEKQSHKELAVTPGRWEAQMSSQETGCSLLSRQERPEDRPHKLPGRCKYRLCKKVFQLFFPRSFGGSFKYQL